MALYKLLSGGHSRWVKDHREEHQANDPATCMMSDLSENEIAVLGSRVQLVATDNGARYADLLALNAPVVREKITGFSLADLKTLLSEEEAGAARKGLTKFITELIEDLEGA